MDWHCIRGSRNIPSRVKLWKLEISHSCLDGSIGLKADFNLVEVTKMVLVPKCIKYISFV